jgi:glycosyltransferase involved in cell wall biosynthesis
VSKREAVSIILVTYNRAYCIGRAIDSVLAQTFSNWELIICDDASPDDTESVAKSYCERDSRIRYHRNPQRYGPPKNRNTGISLSEGELIYFIEDDVVIEPDCLEILVNTLKELKAKGINVGSVGPRTFEPQKQGRLMILERYMANQKRKRMNTPSLVDKWTAFIYENFTLDCGDVTETMAVPAWSLFTRDALKAVGGYAEKAYNWLNDSQVEAEFVIRLRKKGYKLYFQPRAVSHHQHAASGGTRTSSIKYYCYYLVAHIILLLRNFGWKSIYMIPACLLFIVYGVARSIPVLITGRE